MMKKAILFCCICCHLQGAAQAFINEIKKFQQQDSIALPPKKSILFIGSSTFTNWKNVQTYFPNTTIINRGFGGSTLLDVIYYHQQVVSPYHPKKVIVYCGENDIAYSDTVSTAVVLQRFITLFNTIRKQYKKIPIVYVGIKPSAARWKMHEKFLAANQAIQQFLATQKNTMYVNVWQAMLTNNYPTPEIFTKDSLHMNAKGYAIWQQLLQPYIN
jgi:lysophospholipase L1-like esterase